MAGEELLARAQASQDALSREGAAMVERLKQTNVGPMAASLGRDLALAQLRLYKLTVEQGLLFSGDYAYARDPETGALQLVAGDSRVPWGSTTRSLLELGFAPQTYMFTSTSFELKLEISMAKQVEDTFERHDREESKKGFNIGVWKKSVTRVKTVDIKYSASFGYSATASSYLKGELILVPPPERLMQVIRELE